MAESRSNSPEQALKRSQVMASPKNSNSKVYLPSRYAQERKTDKVGFQDILNCTFFLIEPFKQRPAAITLRLKLRDPLNLNSSQQKIRSFFNRGN